MRTIILFIESVLFMLGQAQFVSISQLPTARSDSSVSVIDNRIIVIGGCAQQVCTSGTCSCNNVTSKVEAYSPDTNTWTALEDIPSARYRHSSVVVGKNIYVIGGRDVNDDIQQRVFVFDSSTNTWTTSSLSWTSASSDLVAVSIGNNIYAISGYSASYETLSRTCVFNTVTQASWECTKVPAMNHGRGDACGSIIDGLIYIYGGFSDSDWCAPLNHMEIFDPVTNQWKEGAPLDIARGDSACAAVHGEFHAIGGQKKDSSCIYDVPISDVEHYDLEKKTWVEEEALPTATFRFSGTSFNDIIYVFGGQGYYNNSTGIQLVFNTAMKWEDPNSDIVSSATIYEISICVIGIITLIVM